ncbi:hypothetical protein KBD81_05685 [Candidatus Woesebacteria bacterium]|nr:hypothetical protein [Candidatus Woesebacteria bacterium]
MKSNKKLIITIVVLANIAVILIGLVFYMSRKSPLSEAPKQLPSTPVPDAPAFIRVQDLPKRPASEGGGVDTNTEMVQSSIASLKALALFLPYEKSLESSDGIRIEVVIPPQEFVSNEWTLLAQIFGPDYQVALDDPVYDLEKRAFLLGAREVFSFIEAHNIEPSRVIIQWGDRAIIQDRALLWLAE